MPIDVQPMIISHLDGWWSMYRNRIDDLGDDEHLWSPVPGALTVHEQDGEWIVEIGDRGANPAPFTSLAWRMWHIAVDCLDSYSMRAFGEQSGPDDDRWYGTASEGIARTDAAWACFRDNMAGLDDDGFAAAIGPQFGPFAKEPHATLALHAHAEVTHHAAEVGLLRDLYRLRS